MQASIRRSVPSTARQDPIMRREQKRPGKRGHAKQRLAIFPRQTDVIKGLPTAGEGSPVEWVLVGRRRLGLALVAAIVSALLRSFLPGSFLLHAGSGFRPVPQA